MRKEAVGRCRGWGVSGLVKAAEKFVVRCIVFAMVEGWDVCFDDGGSQLKWR